MQDIFFIADTHLNHNNIIKYCARPFDSIQEMNEKIISNWNDRIKSNDVVYHLGDFGFGEECRKIFKRLNGQKFLLVGNHDKNEVFGYGWGWVKDVYLFKIDNQSIWLSHYPHRSWPKSFHGSWHLFGHVHGRMNSYGLSLDVGVDAWNFCPVSFGQVRDTMLKLNQKEQNDEEAGI